MKTVSCLVLEITDAKFEVTDAKLHVPLVTLSTNESVNLTKQLSEGFKRSVNWKNWWLQTGCLLDYVYFKENYRLIAVDLSKQKALDADPRAIQQKVFQEVVGGDNGTKIRLYTILKQSNKLR